MRHRALLPLALCLLVLPAFPQKKISTPKEVIGFNIGDDYQVANYTQLETYWKKLATESDRMKLVEIGKTAEGRPHYMAIITSPESKISTIASRRSRPVESRATRPLSTT